MSDAAVGLGSGRKTLSPVIHGQSGISPAPTLKLESIRWGSARLWLWRQANYDLEHARGRAEREEAERASLEAVAAAGLRPPAPAGPMMGPIGSDRRHPPWRFARLAHRPWPQCFESLPNASAISL